MKSLSIIVFMVFIIRDQALGYKETKTVDGDYWECSEIGPRKLNNIELKLMAKQHKIDKTEVKTEHIIQPEFINLDPDNYRSEDIVCKIFEKMKHYGDKYEKYPMVCDLKSKDHVFQNETISFTRHPTVIKSHLNDPSSTKSSTGSHNMTCEILQLDGFNHTSNFTWVWYMKPADNFWYKLNVSGNSNYDYQENMFNGINYYSSLKILSVSKADKAEYKCYAENAFGNHEKVFNLEVLGIVSIVAPFIGTFIFVTLLSILAIFYEKVYSKKDEKEINIDEEVIVEREVKA